MVTLIIIAEVIMAYGGSLTRSSVRALRISLVSRAACLVALLASIAVLALLQGQVE